MTVVPRLVVGLWLVAVWILLWGNLTVANLLGGIAVAAILLVAFPTRPATVRPVLRFGPTLAFVAQSLWLLATGTVQVTLHVLGPRRRNPALVAVPMYACNIDVVLVVANVLSLSPGTVTVDLIEGNTTLVIHGLFVPEAGSLQAEILSLERRAIHAFGTRDDRESLARAEIAGPEPRPARIIERFQ